MQFPSEEHEPLYKVLLGEEICFMETEEWCLAFDGLSTHWWGGTWVLLYASDGTNISPSFNLKFFCTYKDAEYEVLIIYLISILKMEIRRVWVQVELKLTIK